LCAGAEFRQHGGCGGIRARALLLRAPTRPHQGPRERGPRQGPPHGALHQVGGGAASKQWCGTKTAGTESDPALSKTFFDADTGPVPRGTASL
jgi:hypothetical protein